MKRLVFILLMAAPFHALAEEAEGGGRATIPRHNCDSRLVQRIWDADDQELMDRVIDRFLNGQKGGISDETFCRKLKDDFDAYTEGGTYECTDCEDPLPDELISPREFENSGLGRREIVQMSSAAIPEKKSSNSGGNSAGNAFIGGLAGGFFGGLAGGLVGNLLFGDGGLFGGGSGGSNPSPIGPGGPPGVLPMYPPGVLPMNPPGILGPAPNPWANPWSSGMPGGPVGFNGGFANGYGGNLGGYTGYTPYYGNNIWNGSIGGGAGFNSNYGYYNLPANYYSPNYNPYAPPVLPMPTSI